MLWIRLSEKTYNTAMIEIRLRSAGTDSNGESLECPVGRGRGVIVGILRTDKRDGLSDRDAYRMLWVESDLSAERQVATAIKLGSVRIVDGICAP